ncbi:CheB methylesterase domain-containing protein, partial [Alicyclobacillus cellulosilyticus]|uniref:CheB methylesterase domain-containing protein n=1 Tax=Alicyclobacillus cellulosilyticus TaxID=1003997 RepID=UPI0016683BB0
GPAAAPSADAHTHSAPAKAPAGRPALVLIGCSTGGPAALQTILPALGGPLPVPVLVVQHIALGFTRHLAERLHQLCRFPVKEAEDGEIARPGTVYIAPSGQQALVVHAPEGVVIRTRPPLASDPPYRPSVDVALTAAAEALGGRVLAVILTGMGKDGLAGCRALKARGGRVIAEAPETCVVYGMPRAVHEAGLADEQAPLYDIPACILRNL